jgi:hypothetical protein
VRLGILDRSTSPTRAPMVFGAVATLCALLFWTAAVASPLSGYKGSDGGWLVLSATTAPGHIAILLGPGWPVATTVKVEFRRVGSHESDHIVATPSGPFNPDCDLSAPLDDATRRAAEMGLPPQLTIDKGDVYSTKVFAVRLPPGDYEIYKVQVTGSTGAMKYYLTTGKDRRLPFRIEPDRVSYIGGLTAVPAGGNFLGLYGFRRWRLVLTDEHERDLAVARHKVADLGAADKAWTPEAPYATSLIGEQQPSAATEGGHQTSRF